MIAGHDSIDQAKFQSFILEAMKTEKSQPEMCQMYEAVDIVFKKNLAEFAAAFSTKPGED